MHERGRSTVLSTPPYKVCYPCNPFPRASRCLTLFPPFQARCVQTTSTSVPADRVKTEPNALTRSTGLSVNVNRVLEAKRVEQVPVTVIG